MRFVCAEVDAIRDLFGYASNSPPSRHPTWLTLLLSTGTHTLTGRNSTVRNHGRIASPMRRSLSECAKQKGADSNVMCKPFTILSSKVAHFDVRSFWRALARQNKKVLTEKCIIDSISSSNASYQILVVHTANDIKGWKPNLDWLRHTLRQRADAHGGKLVAIVLDQHGQLVKQNYMSNDDSGEQISEIIALLGGGGTWHRSQLESSNRQRHPELR